MLHSMDTFKKALEFVLAAEGGYVNDPLDRGGETNFGISKRAYPELVIKSLTKSDASDIYHRDYWLKSKCDQLPPQFAIAVFCAAVNHGSRRSILLLQKSLRVEVDGIIGQHTIAAAHSQNNRYVLGRLLSYRARYYLDIVVKRPSQTKFYRGWLRRLFELQQLIMEVTHAP